MACETSISITTTRQLPLLERQLDDCFARINQPLPALGEHTGTVRVDEFLGQVMHLAARLPEADAVINLCDNRYLFTLGFCAALLRGQTNLLPQNRALATQQQLLDQYPRSYVLHDGLETLLDGCTQLNLNHLDLRATTATAIPTIPADQLAAIAFTSGSTGQPKANLKPWHTFVTSSRMNAKAMLGDNYHGQLRFALATVPAQHMWGLETSLLLPLFARLCISDARPLFPQDVANALQQLPAPRLLISTPVHLRALVSSGVTMPQAAHLLCATAPLSTELAQATETCFGGELLEVYGCSEVGSMARRRTAQEDVWQLFEGLEFAEELSVIRGDHLPQQQPVQDRIETHDGRRFRLLGRSDDMIEIAGKRGSLQEMNKLLLATPGVVDGVVFMPEHGTQAVTRPVALVVATTASKQDVSARFAAHLDAVFMPRPLLLVDALPREDNGKLPRAKLLAFYRQLRSH
ncbi:AMP-binding protein [Cellvibrio sp. pealriver]|uniref:AMP-binding protein n=1 Tax=Cellvibrio sp. pealriver TaxID=1622269 RepID=UPI00066FC6A9|nr:AMP-binding protein [Cellvibrio sp. pealriver]